MNNDTLTIVLWIAAAVVLFIYLARRRKRRTINR
jgi:hypothetical protein